MARDVRRTLMAGLAASMRVFLEKAAGQGRHEPAWFDAIVAALAAESVSRPSALAGAHFKDFQFRGADLDGGQKRCIREAIALATRDEAHALRVTSRPHRACVCAQAAAEVQRPVPARVPAARGAAVDALLDLRVAEAQGARPPQCGGGPRAELRNLRRRLDSQEGPVSVAEWLSSARAAALLGACPRSIASFKSGVAAWFAFAREALALHGRELPPSADGLLAWSLLFRSDLTFSNYISHVKLACQVCGLPVDVFRDTPLRRAKCAIRKRGAFLPRAPLFIREDALCALLKQANERQESAVFAQLFLVTYVFLLRLPSEALGISFDGVAFRQGAGASLILCDGLLQLKLARRKNKQFGSVLQRACWCARCTATCPVHALGAWFAGLPVGTKPFSDITAAGSLSTLRFFLAQLGVKDAALYRTHDLRRGHALDLQQRGGTLREILQAGEWSSPAFLSYLDMTQLELGAVVEAHLAESEDDLG